MNIVLAAFGKRGYHFAAYNLAFSIKHYDPKAKILLIHDSGIKYIPDTSVFDKFHAIDEMTTKPTGIFDPANVKLNTYKIATKYFKEYMFLDVDAIVLKSLQPFYDQVKEMEFATEIRGKGTIDEVINYSVWATNEDIWSEFGLKKKDLYYAPQSSFHFAKRTKDNTAMFKDAVRLNKETFVDRKMLSIKWGAALPDELILGGALARRKFDASFPTPIFYGNKHNTISHMRENFYVMSLFGQGIGNTLTKLVFLEYYDAYMRKMFKEHGKNHIYKVSYIMNDKLINK